MKEDKVHCLATVFAKWEVLGTVVGLDSIVNVIVDVDSIDDQVLAHLIDEREWVFE